MTLSSIRKTVLAATLVVALAGSGPVAAASSDGQQMIEALLAADREGGIRSGIAAMKPGGGACLDAAATDLAKLGAIPLLLAHQKHGFFKHPTGDGDSAKDLERIMAGEGHPLAIDRSQFGLPSGGSECRTFYHISTPLQLGERDYVEIGYDHCGSLCGGGTLVALRMEDGHWAAKDLVIHWAS